MLNVLTNYPNTIGVSRTTDGRDFFVMYGDSQQKTNQGGGAVPPAISPAGILEEWDGSAIVTVATDLSNANGGTIGPQFANSYYAATGHRVVMLNKCSSGSSFAEDTDSNNWTLSGSIYADAITETDQALVALGLTRPTAIFISLGINDCSDVVSTIGEVLTAIPDFINRLLAKYPGTPILISQLGPFSTLSYNMDAGTLTRVARVRQALKRVVENNANVHFCRHYGSFYQNATYWQPNTAHMTQAGLDESAKMLVRWFTNSSYSKWARSIISSHWDDLSTTRKNAIEAFVQTGIGLNLEFFFSFKNTIKQNVFLDWGFLVTPIDGGFNFTTLTSIETSTAPTYMESGYVASVYFYKTNIRDYAQFAKILVNSTAAGTVGDPIAGSTAVMEQTPSSNIIHRIFSGTNTTYSGETKFADASLYLNGRLAGAQFLRKNGSQVSTASVAPTALASATVVFGARNNGTIVNGTDMSFEYGGACKASIDLAQAYTDLEALNTAGF